MPEKKKRYYVYEHVIDETVNILRCVHCDQKPHVGDGKCWKGKAEQMLNEHNPTYQSSSNIQS